MKQTESHIQRKAELKGQNGQGIVTEPDERDQNWINLRHYQGTGTQTELKESEEKK